MFAAPFPARPIPHCGDRLSSPPRRWASVLALFVVLVLHALSDHGTVLDHHVSVVASGAVSAAAGTDEAEQTTAQELAGSTAEVAQRLPPAHPEHQCCHLATSRGAAAAYAPALLAVQPRRQSVAPTDLRAGCAAGPDVAGRVAPGSWVLRV